MIVSKAALWKQRRLQEIRQWQNTRPFRDFVDELAIHRVLTENRSPSRESVLDIIRKARDHATTGYCQRNTAPVSALVANAAYFAR